MNSVAFSFTLQHWLHFGSVWPPGGWWKAWMGETVTHLPGLALSFLPSPRQLLTFSCLTVWARTTVRCWVEASILHFQGYQASGGHSKHSQLVETEAHVVSPHEMISSCKDNWHIGLGLAHFLLCVRKFHLCAFASLEGRAKNRWPGGDRTQPSVQGFLCSRAKGVEESPDLRVKPCPLAPCTGK